MKKVLISIHPQWVVKILNGEKTLEIRKSAPKCELPCEVYIYCTNGREVLKPNKINPQYRKIKAYSIKKGCVCAKFTLNKVGNFDKKSFGTYEEPFTRNQEELLEKSCLTEKELDDYLKGKKGCAWHIDNLVIFDEPKKLSEFNKPDTPTYEQSKALVEMIRHPYTKKDYREDCERLGYALTNAPQSWCYAEAEE